MWRLGSGSLRMPWLPLEAHKRILAKSKKVAKPREFDKSIALKKRGTYDILQIHFHYGNEGNLAKKALTFSPINSDFCSACPKDHF